MATMAPYTFNRIMQRLAAMTLLIDGAFGAASAPASGTCAKGAANALAAVLAATDDHRLRGAAYQWCDVMTTGGYYYHWLTHLLRALERHVQDITAYCAAQQARVHPIIQRIFPAIQREAVFCPEPTEIGTLTCTAGGWQCAQTATIDTTLYGDSLLELVVLNAPIGNAHIIGQIVGHESFGAERMTNAFLVPARAAVGTVIAIPGKVQQPNAAHVLWLDSDETIQHLQGGRPGDALRIRARADWQPALE